MNYVRHVIGLSSDDRNIRLENEIKTLGKKIKIDREKIDFTQVVT